MTWRNSRKAQLISLTISLRRVGFVLVALGLILLAAWLVRVTLIARSLRSNVAQLQARSRESDLAPICVTMWATNDDVTRLRYETGMVVTLAPLFGWAPVIGNDLSAAPHLLDAADALTDAGSSVCEAFAWSGIRDVTIGGVTRAFAENQALIKRAADSATRADQVMSSVRSDTLSEPLSARVASFQSGLSLARGGLQMATLMPWFGGFDRPRTYLVVVLNEDELRPGGGFVTGVGEVRIQAGRVASMVFRDSYGVDDFTKPYPDPPAPLTHFMGIDQWTFRDSNWSPDFPTAARQAIALYRPQGGVLAIDGVIALDQRAVQDLIAVVGTLRVPDSTEPITGANVIAYIRHAWAPSDGDMSRSWFLQRKAFMGPLAEAALNRIESGGFDKIALAQTFLRQIEGKHVQIFLDYPEAEAILHKQAWDGALRQTGGDYLMVVDSNVGYNKVNARVRQSMTYQVDLTVSPPRAEITLVYTNTAGINYPCRPESRYDSIYEQMMNRCYWDYVRTYVPSTHRLDDATRIPIPASAVWRNTPDRGTVIARKADEGPFLSLESAMVLPPASSQTRQYALTLDENMVKWNASEGSYGLLIQKQAGTRSYPVTVQILIPQPSIVVEVQPREAVVEGDKVTWRFQLDRDQELRLRFRRW